MGLDMFAWSVAQEDVIDDFTITKRDDSYPEVCYWRKHYSLHKWMEALYRTRGGEQVSFNCIPVRLYPEDLQRLEQDIKAQKVSRDDPNDAERDLLFVEEAQIIISQGRAIYYDSWW